jgi:hypothetical protein
MIKNVIFDMQVAVFKEKTVYAGMVFLAFPPLFPELPPILLNYLFLSWHKLFLHIHRFDLLSTKKFKQLHILTS